MIWRPKVGRRVVVRYAPPARGVLPHHGREATVRGFAARARGPKNVLVEFDGGLRMIVPRGNLFRAAEGG
jgi:hypothetical protein